MRQTPTPKHTHTHKHAHTPTTKGLYTNVTNAGPVYVRCSAHGVRLLTERALKSFVCVIMREASSLGARAHALALARRDHALTHRRSLSLFPRSSRSRHIRHAERFGATSSTPPRLIMNCIHLSTALHRLLYWRNAIVRAIGVNVSLTGDRIGHKFPGAVHLLSLFA